MMQFRPGLCMSAEARYEVVLVHQECHTSGYFAGRNVKRHRANRGGLPCVRASSLVLVIFLVVPLGLVHGAAAVPREEGAVDVLLPTHGAGNSGGDAECPGEFWKGLAEDKATTP